MKEIVLAFVIYIVEVCEILFILDSVTMNFEVDFCCRSLYFFFVYFCVLKFYLLDSFIPPEKIHEGLLSVKCVTSIVWHFVIRSA